MDRKIYLITGDRKGIGRSLSEYYLSEGHMVIGCSRTGSDLVHDNYDHLICDVSDEKAVKHLILFIRQKFKRIDVLINNAGMASMNHILTTPISTFEKLVNTNFRGTFLFIREGSKIMRKNGGSIINFSTVASPLNLEGEAIYASTKAAIEKLTKISAHELSSFNIRINCVGPTPIYTDLIKAVPKDKIEKLLSSQAIKRLGNFDDIKNIIDFYCSEKSNFITGQIIYLGGV
jgi:3-oxoacyl-[acyl-carrier protein] reductase